MPDIFESESDFNKWRVQYGVPTKFSISDINTEEKAREKEKKDQLFDEILDLFSNEEIRPLLRENQYYPRINEVLSQLEGMIYEELKIVRSRLKSLLKHQQPSQVTKLFKYLLEY